MVCMCISVTNRFFCCSFVCVCAYVQVKYTHDIEYSDTHQLYDAVTTYGLKFFIKMVKRRQNENTPSAVGSTDILISMRSKREPTSGLIFYDKNGDIE